MGVDLVFENGPHAGVSRRELLRRAKVMMTALQLNKEELSITLTNDDQIQILNRDYRGKDKPTDVLAFAMREGEFASFAGGMLGDVIISVETARRQADAIARSVLDEVTMLMAHGLLHLLGWDHDTKAKDKAMRAETDRLCEAATGGKDANTVPLPPLAWKERDEDEPVRGRGRAGSRGRKGAPAPKVARGGAREGKRRSVKTSSLDEQSARAKTSAASKRRASSTRKGSSTKETATTKAAPAKKRASAAQKSPVTPSPGARTAGAKKTAAAKRRAATGARKKPSQRPERSAPSTKRTAVPRKATSRARRS